MYYLFLNGPINQLTSSNTQILLSNARNDGETQATLCIASHGGDVNSGLCLYNFLRMFSLPVNTHSVGACCSIAATIFLAGKKRTAAPASFFSIHASVYSEGELKGQITPNTAEIAQPFREILNWGDNEVAERFVPGEGLYINATEAVKFGIVTEILRLNIGPNDRVQFVAN